MSSGRRAGDAPRGARRLPRLWLTLACCASLVGACGSSDPDPEPQPIKIVDAYVAMVRWQLGSATVPTTTGSALPVVYVTRIEGAQIDAGSQAFVVRELTEHAQVRFADQPDDALVADDPDKKVKDDGTLLKVGEYVAEGDRATLPVTVYRTAKDSSEWVLDVARVGKQVMVSGSTPRP